MSFCFVVFWEWRARNNFVILSAAREKGACETKSDVMFLKKCSSLEARVVSSLLCLPLMNPWTLHCLVFHYIYLLFKSCLQSLVQIPSLLLLLSDHLFILFLGLISSDFFSCLCHRNKSSPHMHALPSGLTPGSQHKLIRKQKIALPCFPQALRLHWSFINWFDDFILMSSCQPTFCINILSYIVIVSKAKICWHIWLRTFELSD